MHSLGLYRWGRWGYINPEGVKKEGGTYSRQRVNTDVEAAEQNINDHTQRATAVAASMVGTVAEMA